MKTYSVDRIETPYGILQNEKGKMITVPLSKLPENIKEGDLVKKTGRRYSFLKEETLQRKTDLFAFQNELINERNHSSSGDENQ